MTHLRKTCLFGAFLISFLSTPGITPAQKTNHTLSKQAFTVTTAQSTYIRQTLTRTQIRELTNIGKTLAHDPDFAAVETRWSALISTLAGGKRTIDVEALTRWVLSESFKETTRTLDTYTERVHELGQLKTEMSRELQNARNGLDSWTKSSAFKTTYSVDLSERRTESTRITSKASMANYVSDLEAELVSVGNDEQLATVDLQNSLQKREQVLQALSNISDLLNDTTMRILRNLD